MYFEIRLFMISYLTGVSSLFLSQNGTEPNIELMQKQLIAMETRLSSMESICSK